MNETAALLLAALPTYEVSLTIEHNTFKECYRTFAEEVALIPGYDEEDWLPGDREVAIQTNECWEIRWYPNTLVGFSRVYGSTLAKALENLQRYRDFK